MGLCSSLPVRSDAVAGDSCMPCVATYAPTDAFAHGGRGTIAERMSNGSYDEPVAINGGARGRKGSGVTFVVRLEDGNLVIPPGSKTDPKDML
jgi:hypothetical protein